MKKKNYLEEFEGLSKLIGNLEKVYNNIADDEINNSLTDELLKEYINQIMLYRDAIYRKFDRASFTDKELLNIYDLVISLNHLEQGFDQILSVINLNENNKINRILRMLYEFSSLTHLVVVEEVDVNNKTVYKNPDDKDEDDCDKQKQREKALEEEAISDQISMLFDELYIHTFMDYLLEAIEHEKNIRVKNELIKVKYRMIFIFDTLERNFIGNPKSFTKSLVYQRKLDRWLEENPNAIKNYCLNNNNNDTCKKLFEIIEYDAEYYKNYKNKTKALLKSIFIKANLSVCLSKKSFNDIIRFKEGLLNSAKSKKAAKSIKNAYKLDKKLTLEKRIDFDK